MTRKLIDTDIKLGAGTLLKEAIDEHIELERLAPNSDIDSIIQTGIYHVNTNNNAKTMLNIPIEKAGILIVYKGYLIRQDYLSYDGNDFHIRIYYPYGNSWSEWKKI